jgi:hypothetical protein
VTDPIPSGESVRDLRAAAVLERLGTADARKLLAELAFGVVETDEARAALVRMHTRPRGP